MFCFRLYKWFSRWLSLIFSLLFDGWFPPDIFFVFWMITARNAELGQEVVYSQVLGLESKFIFLRLQDRCIVPNTFAVSGFSKIWLKFKLPVYA